MLNIEILLYIYAYSFSHANYYLEDVIAMNKNN